MSTATPNFKINFDQNSGVLYLEGHISVRNAAMLLKQVQKKLKKYNGDRLNINLDHIDQIDSAGVSVIDHLKNKYNEAGIEVTVTGGSEPIQEKIRKFSYSQPDTTLQKIATPGMLESIGEQVIDFFTDKLTSFLFLMADVFYWSAVDVFNKKSSRKGEFYNQAVLIGVNAVTIVAAMAFIIGLVLALQSAAQLRNVGANIFIVDLTVIAMMREMGPLITAIIVAGRSGSAIAAEIATMKVTSELDALKTMAMNPVRFVIVPKMHGSIVTMPLLTILADVMGILGGILVAYFYLDISATVFFNRMGESLHNRDILIGFIKSLVFGALIVLTGSYFGFRVEKGAEGVGKVTTQAVVVSISLVIIADSLMGLIFY